MYCIQGNPGQAVENDIDAGAAVWNNNPAPPPAPGAPAPPWWQINKVNNCANARVIIRYARRTMMDILADETHNGDFTPTRWGGELIGDVIKPCLEQATITIYSNVDWTQSDRVNCAAHELGHALGLLDVDNNADIMHKDNTKNRLPSAADQAAAAEALARRNINQLHQLFRPGGGELTFAGTKVLVATGALESELTLGIRPLSGTSLPALSELPEGTRLVAVAHIVAEWLPGEFERGATYTEKPVALKKPITVEFQLTEQHLTSLAAMPDQRGVGAPPSAPVTRESLRLARLDFTGGPWKPLNNSTVDVNTLVVRGEAMSLGTFGVIGTPQSAGPPPFSLRVVVIVTALVAAIAIIIFVLARRRR